MSPKLNQHHSKHQHLEASYSTKWTIGLATTATSRGIRGQRLNPQRNWEMIRERSTRSNSHGATPICGLEANIELVKSFQESTSSPEAPRKVKGVQRVGKRGHVPSI